MRISSTGLLVVLALFAAPSAHAQSTDPPGATPKHLPPILRVDAPPPTSSGHPLHLVQVHAEGERSSAWLAAGGVAGGAVGMFGGMLAGALIDGPADEDCIDFCFGPGLILGTLVGEAAGVALGVHLANGRGGSLPAGMLASTGIMALGLFAATEEPAVLLAVPVAQIISAVRVERRSGRNR